MNTISYIIKLNGIYDILCAISIMHWLPIPYLDRLHLSMIKDPTPNAMFERFLAYWIFTYGVIRLSNNYLLICCSYILEAMFFSNELILGSVYSGKTIFVILFSLLFAYLSYWEK
jgi:hypothetical protein